MKKKTIFYSQNTNLQSVKWPEKVWRNMRHCRFNDKKLSQGHLLAREGRSGEPLKGVLPQHEPNNPESRERVAGEGVEPVSLQDELVDFGVLLALGERFERRHHPGQVAVAAPDLHFGRAVPDAAPARQDGRVRRAVYVVQRLRAARGQQQQRAQGDAQRRHRSGLSHLQVPHVHRQHLKPACNHKYIRFNYKTRMFKTNCKKLY